MMLNVIERRFVLLGIVFPPQDLYLVVLIALSALVTLVLVTVVAGRIWCGWLCPQTVFMEMVFRRLEYLIDGSAEQQLRRNRGPWTADRVRAHDRSSRRVFLALSLVIANVFLAWVIGAGAVRRTDRRHAAAPSRRLHRDGDLHAPSSTWCSRAFASRPACWLPLRPDDVVARRPAHGHGHLRLRARGEPRGRRAAAARRARPATASTATGASRSARPASTSATAFSSSASTARPASMRATTSWRGWGGRPA